MRNVSGNNIKFNFYSHGDKVNGRANGQIVRMYGQRKQSRNWIMRIKMMVYFGSKLGISLVSFLKFAAINFTRITFIAPQQSNVTRSREIFGEGFWRYLVQIRINIRSLLYPSMTSDISCMRIRNMTMARFGALYGRGEGKKKCR